MSKFIQNIFSVKNELGHKVWTIWGIKIKYKHIHNYNKIILHKTNGKTVLNPKIKGLRVRFFANNSTVEIFEPCKFNNTKIDIGQNCFIKFNETMYAYNNLYINADYANNFNVTFGKNSSCGELTIRACGAYNSYVSVGENCAISTNVLIQPLDGHWILDKDTQEIINDKITGIEIADHVWISRNVSINKNVKIPKNSIVALGAVVVKEFSEENVVIAGVPAKITKRNIDWRR